MTPKLRQPDHALNFAKTKARQIQYSQRRTNMSEDKKTWGEALTDEHARDMDNLPTVQDLPEDLDDWDQEDWEFLIRRNDYK